MDLCLDRSGSDGLKIGSNRTRLYYLFISHSWTYSDTYDALVDLLKARPYFRLRDYSVPMDDRQVIGGILWALQRDDGDGTGGGRARRSGETAPRARLTLTVRVYKHGSGARRDLAPRGVGRSRDGWTTKLHVLVDDCGGPRSLRLTPGSGPTARRRSGCLRTRA